MKHISKFILILLSFNLISSKDLIRIPFGLHSTKANETLIENIFNNIVYANLSLGTPAQILPSKLEINSQTFYFPSSLFNKEKSNSFHSSPETEIEYEEIETAFLSTDTLHINGKDKTINFLLSDTDKQKLGNIGLLLPHQTDTGVYSFFQSLNKAELINSYSWTLKYFQNISLVDSVSGNRTIGELIIGDEPHNYEKNHKFYDGNNFQKIPTQKDEGIDYYDLHFDSVYIKDNKNELIPIEAKQGYHYAEILPDISFIVGTEHFFDFIENKFFNKYYSSDVCQEILLGYYFYIKCDKSKFKVEEFPSLYFEHRGLNSILELNYKDLFIEDKTSNSYLFLILRYQFENEDWQLGTPFLRKFQLVFNEESKTIGYYTSNGLSDDEVEEEKGGVLIYFVIGGIIVLALIGGVAVYLMKKNKSYKDKKSTEFQEDDFAYHGGSMGV